MSIVSFEADQFLTVLFTNHLSMLLNNLKITWRNLLKNWNSSLLNITGLTLGILGSIIIFLTVKYEFSFDTHHKNAAEIYRVTNNYYYPTFTMHVGQTPDPMADAIKTDFPDFKNSFAIYSSFNHKISVGDQIFESDILYAGPEFIQAFDFYNDPSQWVIGNPNDILKEVNKTVLTKSLAIKIYGSSEEAIGKIITLRNNREIEVTGILEDPPNNTNYPFEQLVSYPTYKNNYASDSFGGVSSTTTFVQLPAAVDVESLRPALNKFNKKYMETAWGEDFVSMDLQPLSNIHFDERFGSNNYTTSETYLWTLGLIGLFMILIACINFVNLATAKAVGRSKEIGMRKILGSSKKDIIVQFMGESFMLAFISLFMGITLSQMLFPYFSEISNLNIGNDFSYTSDLILFITGLLLFITFAMGLYPAIVLSKFKPLEVVRQKFNSSPIKGLTLRRGLIAFQLTTSQAMVIGAIVIACQLHFFKNKDLGFEKDGVLVVNIHGGVPMDKVYSLENKMSQLPFIKQTSLTSTVPMTGHNSTTALTSKDSEMKERFNVQYIYADNKFADVMNFELLAGKTSVTEIEEDTVRGFVVNETLIDRLVFGSPEEALGKSINVHGFEANIIGVVKDFHTLSLHEEIKPVAMVYGAHNYQLLAMKYNPQNMQQSIGQMESTWNEMFPDHNFDFYFQDQHMGDMYESEIRFAKIIQAFTLISLIIACIGLIGLSAYSSMKKYKEIGVRKVLGATVPHILFLMSKEFIILTIVSFVLSIPVAYYFINAWLEGFAYRINMEWWMVVAAGGLTLFLTLMTVGLKSIKAAFVNPIESLRNE